MSTVDSDCTGRRHGTGESYASERTRGNELLALKMKYVQTLGIATNPESYISAYIKKVSYMYSIHAHPVSATGTPPSPYMAVSLAASGPLCLLSVPHSFTTASTCHTG